MRCIRDKGAEVSVRAAEMARIMMEEWNEGEEPVAFLRKHFGQDTMADVGLALKIAEELIKADRLEQKVL